MSNPETLAQVQRAQENAGTTIEERQLESVALLCSGAEAYRRDFFSLCGVLRGDSLDAPRFQEDLLARVFQKIKTGTLDLESVLEQCQLGIKYARTPAATLAT
ncbi:MAG: hypothetical protein V1926_05870 [Candidatus Peregrinibacteria bacterium]